MDAALGAVETNGLPDIDALARSSGLPEALHEPYAAWMEALVGHYMELLAAAGDSFESQSGSVVGEGWPLVMP